MTDNQRLELVQEVGALAQERGDEGQKAMEEAFAKAQVTVRVEGLSDEALTELRDQLRGMRVEAQRAQEGRETAQQRQQREAAERQAQEERHEGGEPRRQR